MFPGAAISRYTLPSGRTIYLVAFNQRHNAAGIFIGRRNPRRNGEYLNDLVRRQKQDFPGVALIPPDGGFDGVSADFPFGAPEHLPEITCTAEFRSAGPVRDDSELASALTLIWLQSAFGGLEALDAALAKVDWEQDARDYSP